MCVCKPYWPTKLLAQTRVIKALSTTFTAPLHNSFVRRRKKAIDENWILLSLLLVLSISLLRYINIYPNIMCAYITLEKRNAVCVTTGKSLYVYYNNKVKVET